MNKYKESYDSLLQYFFYEADKKGSSDSDTQDAFFVTIRDFINNFKMVRGERARKQQAEKRKSKRKLDACT
jgi:hypothetical protein